MDLTTIAADAAAIQQRVLQPTPRSTVHTIALDPSDRKAYGALADYADRINHDRPHEARELRRTIAKFRRNPHCSNCGDLRGGPFGHQASECTYRRRARHDVVVRGGNGTYRWRCRSCSDVGGDGLTERQAEMFATVHSITAALPSPREGLPWLT